MKDSEPQKLEIIISTLLRLRLHKQTVTVSSTPKEK